MKLMFIGADHEVTGSCHYLQVGEKNILVDYGMEQGKDFFENAKLPVNEAEIDYVLLTHAHVDHSGMLPLLFARGFRGKIYTTTATSDLCNIMLRDCAHIQQQEAEWRSRKGKRNSEIKQTEPIYTMEDAINVLRLFVPCAYSQVIDLCEGVKIRFTDIGHLLGSASIEVWATEKDISRKLVFSGDIGNTRQPLIKDPKKTSEADFVVMESTYGDRLHTTERPDYIKQLTEIFEDTFRRGGNVVIPSFAIGRTQEMLYFIRKIKKEGLVKCEPDFPVYVDSPLAVEATQIFADNQYECYDDEAMELVHEGINPISFPGLKLSITSEESQAINFEETPKVIISASGMCDAGRIKHHLKHNLWREDSTILFVGYQSVGTLGRSIIDGADHVKIFGEPIDIKAKVLKLEGLSGHADKNGLTDWLLGFKEKPRKVFIVHGEDMVTISFAEYLKKEHGFDTYAPYSGTVYDLAAEKFITEGVPVPIQAKASGRANANDVFTRLLAAGERLMAIIRRSEGLTNKELGKFADQINSLCDKHQN